MKKTLRITAFFLSICIATLFLSSVPTSTLSVEPKDNSTAISYEQVKAQLEKDVFNKINEIRKKKGLAPYSWNIEIEGIAEKRAKGISSCFKHTLPDGREFENLYYDANIAFGYVGENIAYGYNSAESVVDAWQKHAVHKDLLYSPYFTYCTIGVYITPSGKIYYAAEFMSK